MCRFDERALKPCILQKPKCLAAYIVFDGRSDSPLNRASRVVNPSSYKAFCVSRGKPFWKSPFFITEFVQKMAIATEIT